MPRLAGNCRSGKRRRRPSGSATRKWSVGIRAAKSPSSQLDGKRPWLLCGFARFRVVAIRKLRFFGRYTGLSSISCIYDGRAQHKFWKWTGTPLIVPDPKNHADGVAVGPRLHNLRVVRQPAGAHRNGNGQPRATLGSAVSGSSSPA